MAGEDREIQKLFADLPFKMKRKLAQAIKDEADKLATAIKEAAPRRTGALANSVKVRRRKDDLDLVVTAGGAATTKLYSRGVGYEREVTVGQGDNQSIGRGGSGVSYDYSLAVEFGSTDHPAEPFFYPTARRMQPEIQENIQKAIDEVLG